jgi:hypothetical protein
VTSIQFLLIEVNLHLISQAAARARKSIQSEEGEEHQRDYLIEEDGNDDKCGICDGYGEVSNRFGVMQIAKSIVVITNVLKT